MKSVRKSFCTFLAMAALFAPKYGDSCAPSFPVAVFTYQNHPGAPLKDYAAGNLGVVLPSYARSYLLIAYRYFSGQPLSPAEQRDALRYWHWRFSGGWTDEARGGSSLQLWLKARASVLGEEATRATLSPDDIYATDKWTRYVNCNEDAFRNAALTLKDRARRFGSARAELREWVLAQDAVFQNCARKGNLPDPPSGNKAAWLNADRRYQIAAARLYQGDFEKAAGDFDQISHDPSSPWQHIAPYLAARALTRKAVLQLDGKPEPGARHWAEQATARLEKILHDTRTGELRTAARKLLNHIQFEFDRESRIGELGRSLSRRSQSAGFYQDLIDYSLGMDASTNFVPDYWNSDREKTSKEVEALTRKWYQREYNKLAPLRRSAELTDWVLTIWAQEHSSLARDHAMKQWKKKHSTPWLVAAMAGANDEDNIPEELLVAASSVPASNPAFPTLAYHRARLLLDSGRREQALALLNEVMPLLKENISYSSFNLFVAERMQVATDFKDFLALAGRPAARVLSQSPPDEETAYCYESGCDHDLLYGKDSLKPRFDKDAARLLNLRMPVELLAEAVLRPELPEALRGELSAALWTRSVMLGRHDVAARILEVMEKAYPRLQPSLRSYAAASMQDQKDHEALLILLSNPGLRPYVNAGAARETPIFKIDNYRDNWWCTDLGADLDNIHYAKWIRDGSGHAIRKDDTPPFPEYLTREQRTQADSEWRRLAAFGPGPNFLMMRSLQWAHDDPTNPKVPQALHLAIRSNHYGCGGSKTSALGHKVFTLLHGRYPQSKWAEQTPYWY
ncbi:MAG: hypothetical protein LAP21_07310 [Acidobacteriia bacterium]|nr:hypothetical protein [Terriglobia bacterium]